MHLDAVATEDWQWFQGLFSADGNKILYRDKYGKHYLIRISLDKTHDLPIAEKCIRIIEALGLTATALSQGNCLQIKVSSKLLFDALSKIPAKPNTTPAYVAGAIDGDGWIDHGAIQFGQSHVPELFDAIADFFKKIDMPVETWCSKRNYRRMYIPYPTLKLSDVLNYSLKAHTIQSNAKYQKFAPPSQCTMAELEAFYQLVLKSGKVEKTGLKDKIKRAKLLAFHYESKTLAGIAAMKLPSKTYKRRVFMQAAANQESSKYGLELGWAFTVKGYRKKHICSRLVGKIVNMYKSHNIFATTNVTNSSMQRILQRNGFQKTGKPFEGRLNGTRDYTLQLFSYSSGAESNQN